MAKKKRRYSQKASEEVGEALHKLKRGKQRSGTKSKAKSRKQAIAIGLSKARKEGAKVPPAPKKKAAGTKKTSSAKKKSGKKKSSKKKSGTKKAGAKKKSSKATRG